jgi:cytochrome c peroxidase
MAKLALGLALTLSACESSLDPAAPVDSSTGDGPNAAKWGNDPLDQVLLQTLTARAPRGDVARYRLPDSHQLGRIPQDPENRLTPAKVELGRLLFHETALGVNNVRPEGLETYSCASCHHAQGGFAANVPQGMAEGGLGFGITGEGRTPAPGYDSNPDSPDCQPIRTPSTMNSAYQPLMLWNGQFGGVGDNVGTEAQWAVGTPLESNRLGLHGLETQAHAGLVVHRMGSVELSRVASLPEYADRFARAFPGDHDPITRTNVALAIAAYERTLLANHSPFQRWLRGDVDAMTDTQKQGGAVFFGKGGCVSCHDGPALSSMSFYALGMYDLDGCVDMARVDMRPFGGTIPEATRQGRGGFTQRPEDMYKFKTPQLYNLADSPFYGHGASFASVREVVEYKNAAVPQNPHVPASQLAARFVPLGLSPEEIDDLVVFLEEALYDPDLDRYEPAALPSGNCFPSNDPQAQLDLGCGLGKVASR